MRFRTLLFWLLPLFASAQNVIIPWWGTPFPDGVIAAGEWDAAPSVLVPTGTGNSSEVFVACDAWGLYFAFLGHLESAIRFPEVLIDVQHDRTMAWNGDDHWFHVSATACHHLGHYGVYDDCSPLPGIWSAHPLMIPGPPSTDHVEIAIPWSMLGVTPQAGDTLGLGLVLTNTSSVWNLWPAGASHLSPATWGHLVIPGATGLASFQAAPLRVAPNPTNDQVVLQGPWSQRAQVEVLDITGRVVLTQAGTDPPQVIHLGHLNPGRYLLRVTSPQGVWQGSVMRQ